MPRPVYSVPFHKEQGASGHGSSTTVPLGHVYVVRFITIYSNPTVGNMNVFFQDDVSGAALVHVGANLGNTISFTLDCHLVFLNGGGFHFQVNNAFGDVADVSACGYDLTAA